MTGLGKNLWAGILFVNVTVRSMILPLISISLFYDLRRAPAAGSFIHLQD